VGVFGGYLWSNYDFNRAMEGIMDKIPKKNKILKSLLELNSLTEDLYRITRRVDYPGDDLDPNYRRIQDMRAELMLLIINNIRFDKITNRLILWAFYAAREGRLIPMPGQ
jgi:hypothetical protein